MTISLKWGLLVLILKFKLFHLTALYYYLFERVFYHFNLKTKNWLDNVTLQMAAP